MKSKHFFTDIIFIFVGCVMLAFAITAILEPNHLMTGGITGLSIMIDKVTGIHYTITYYLFSLMILGATHFFLGKYEARKILLLSILFPAVLLAFNFFQFKLIEDDLFLAAIYYGIIGGTGVGLILKRGYSTGGTDSIGKIIHKRKYPFISINQIITVIDIGIIIVSILAFSMNIALYAIITQLVLLKTIETVMYGLSPKLVKLEIISKSEVEISDFILNEIRRGISKYSIIGGYSNETRTKLVTICSPRESVLIRNKVAEVDENAFANILPVMSVWGEGLGFDRIKEEQR